MSSIPTDADFKRAKKLMRERSRNLESVREEVLRRFRGRAPLHNVYVLAQRDVDFRAYIFFRTEHDVAKCRRSGVTERIKEAIIEELHRVGRGGKTGISVDFEVDSDENVRANFEGDYFLRLR